MAGLAILKHSYGLSDEVLCERWGGEPLLPILLRRGVLPAPAGVRSLVTNTLANPRGRGTVTGAAPGESVDRRQDQGDQAIRAVTGDRRYHGSAQERDVPHRCETSEPGAREAGAAGAATWGG